MAIMGLAFITQIASITGAMTELNMMVWHTGVMGGIPLLHLVAYIISSMAFEQGHETTASNGAAVQGFAKSAMRSNFANGAYLLFTIMQFYDGWFAAQWLKLEDSAKETYVENLETKLMEMGKAMDEKYMAMGGGAAKKGDEEEEEEAEEGADEEGEEGADEEGEADEEQ